MKPAAVLIHGWGTTQYNNQLRQKEETNAFWDNKSSFIKKLSEHFDIYYYNLPGFCGKPEPKADSWKLDDFVTDLKKWLDNHCPHPTLIIGFSFGGGLSAAYKLKYSSNIPIALVAPALVRNQNTKSRFAKSLKIGSLFPSLVKPILLHFYLMIVNPYYKLGSGFIRRTYMNIVREDLRPQLANLNKDEVIFIYGEADDVTPFSMVSEALNKSQLAYKLIPNAGHNLAKTHPIEVAEIVIKYFEDVTKS